MRQSVTTAARAIPQASAPQAPGRLGREDARSFGVGAPLLSRGSRRSRPARSGSRERRGRPGSLPVQTERTTRHRVPALRVGRSVTKCGLRPQRLAERGRDQVLQLKGESSSLASDAGPKDDLRSTRAPASLRFVRHLSRRRLRDRGVRDQHRLHLGRPRSRLPATLIVSSKLTEDVPESSEDQRTPNGMDPPLRSGSSRCQVRCCFACFGLKAPSPATGCRMRTADLAAHRGFAHSGVNHVGCHPRQRARERERPPDG